MATLWTVPPQKPHVICPHSGHFTETHFCWAAGSRPPQIRGELGKFNFSGFFLKWHHRPGADGAAASGFPKQFLRMSDICVLFSAFNT